MLKDLDKVEFTDGRCSGCRPVRRLGVVLNESIHCIDNEDGEMLSICAAKDVKVVGRVVHQSRANVIGNYGWIINVVNKMNDDQLCMWLSEAPGVGLCAIDNNGIILCEVELPTPPIEYTEVATFCPHSQGGQNYHILKGSDGNTYIRNLSTDEVAKISKDDLWAYMVHID